MKKTIRLTESDLHNIISRCVSTLLNEDGEDGLMVGSSDASGGVTYPAFGGKVQRRQIYNAKDKGKSKINQVDMSDALKRHNGKDGSVSINNL